jgi:hypothetical protein
MELVKYKCCCCFFKKSDEDIEMKEVKEKKPKRKVEEWEKCFGHDRVTGQRTCCWETPQEWGMISHCYLRRLLTLEARFFLAWRSSTRSLEAFGSRCGTSTVPSE